MPSSRKILELKYAVSFTLRFVILVFVGVGIFGALLVFLLNRQIGPTYLNGISTLSQLQAYLPIIIFITALAQTAALCTVSFLLALVWSHAIAGPLVRFRRHLRNLAHGVLPKEPIAFRDADQLQGIAQAFSEMMLLHSDSNVRALTLLASAQKIIESCKTLMNQEKADTHGFDLKLKELKGIYLKIKQIYTAGKPN